WMSFVQGFGGLRVENDYLVLNPFLPEKWRAYSFKVLFRGVLLKVGLSSETLKINNQSNQDIQLRVYGKVYSLPSGEIIEI
ncbi:MAG: glycosyl hydrolase family 65 protein, partial [Halanaerobiales bacterium]